MGSPGNIDVDNEPRVVRGIQDSDDQRGAERSQDPGLLKTLSKQGLVGTQSRSKGFMSLYLYPSPLKEVMGTGPQTSAHLSVPRATCSVCPLSPRTAEHPSWKMVIGQHPSRPGFFWGCWNYDKAVSPS